MARFKGGSADDRFDGGRRDDVAYGMDGNDWLSGGAGDDALFGGDGDDVLLPGSGVFDYADGGWGNNTLSFVNAREAVALQGAGGWLDTPETWDYGIFAEGDIYYPSSEFSSIHDVIGSRFDDLISGRFGYSYAVLDPWTGTSVQRTVGGVDDISGGGGADTIKGYFGEDRLSGDAGDDTLDGGESDDRLLGGVGNDRLSGSFDNDWLSGGRGDDTIDGGSGRDRLIGGAGADLFIFSAGDSGGVGEMADRIYDFDAAAGDRIDLSTFDGDSTTTELHPVVFIGSGAPTGRAGEVWVTYVGADAFIHIDTDGDAVTNFDLRLNNVSSLSPDHFVM